MTQKNSSPKSSNKQQYSVGTLLVTILLVGAYWWLTGSLPGNDATGNNTPVANAPVTLSTAEAATVESSSGITATAEVTAPETVASEVISDSMAAPTAEEPTVEAPTAEPPTEVATEDATAESTATTPPTAMATAPSTATSTVAPTATVSPTPTATKPPKPTATPTNPPRAGPRGMAVMTLDDLPPEAVKTVDLILQGGPFPYDRDGITFQNREGLLPRQARGYYSEYTVITPGSRDRGARRIITGEEGEFYYTDDHYESFAWVEVP